MSLVSDYLHSATHPRPGRLPAPSGPYPVGTAFATLTDESRPGLFRPGEPREIPVQLWFPAASRGARWAAYLPGAAAATAFAQALMLPPVFGALAQRPSHSATDVEIAAGRFPVVLYSHGYGSFGGANLLQHEHLASHGFIVASLTHLHEAAYPMRKPFGGPMKSIRPVMKAAQKKFGKDMVQDPAAMAWIMERVDPMYAQADVWEADSRFVADWLFRSPWGPHAVPGRYGAYGHSFGGATAGQLGVRDPRCAGWANLDGGFFCASHREVTSKPGLVLAGSEAIASGLAPGQTGYWEVVVPGAGHYDFMDMRVMLPSFRLAPATGTADPVALSTLMNDWLLAFFKSALLGEPIPATLLTRHGLANVKKH